MLLINPAKPKYLSGIYSMILALAKQEGILDKIQLSEQQLGQLLFCDAPNHFVATALIEEKLVGVVLFNFIQHNVCCNVTKGIYIETLYVEPKFRSNGIGKALFTYVAKEAEEKSCSRIEWWVSANKASISQFYQNLGGVALDQWIIFKCDKQGIAKLTRKIHEL